MVGLSLSMCVRDLAEGKVRYKDVAYISTGTYAPTAQDFLSVLDTYSTTYWRDYPKKAQSIALWLWYDGKIIQPRTMGKQPLSLDNGHWQA